MARDSTDSRDGRGTNKDTKGRIVDASGGLFRRNGYTGTGLKQIATAAGAPFGSIYHFFPGGKEQLGAEVIRWSGEMYLRLFETAMDAAPDVVTGVRDFFAGAAETLRETDYADACPIAAVALEVASTNEPLRQATAEVFTSWIDAGTEHLATSGLSRETGRTLMISMLAGLEGAFVLSRALRSTEPVEVAGATAVAAVREALREVQ
ncbi:TetR/AcrR family transcriptional regulator [Microtetraspora malaysiensis]|uniref:TetR/AcrR family transcriptional regulator n=1 Tax=Microtetraspora malaysiensis TaxID=161358 RepID=UPI003D92CAC9